jgi:transposase InsO family protein
MGIQAPPEVKFALIREATLRDDNLLKISVLCDIAGVSRSGYYNWCSKEPVRKARNDSDKKDFDLVLEAYRFRGYSKGARGIHMRLLHMGIIMNVKKIRRLMQKFGLKCPIRKANPYRRMTKALATNNVAGNVVNRKFRRAARKVLLTDITYLFFKDGHAKCYLSTILDAFTHEILAYEVSMSFKVDFVLDTVDALIAEHGSVLDNETIVHSDQGCHYTSNAFIRKIKDTNFVQSMSRRGNCWDNAPQESFYGHMKDEINDLIYSCNSFKEVEVQIDDWIDYYNKDRGQWELLKLTPSEYYEYLQTGIYPLPVYVKPDHRGSAPNPEV